MSQDLTPEGDHDKQQEVFERFLENQKAELALRGQELEFAKSKDENALEFSKAALAAQERDRLHSRECERKIRKDKQLFLLLILVVLVALVGVALALGKDAVAMEIVKAIIYLSAGVAAGYGYASRKTEQSEDVGE